MLQHTHWINGQWTKSTSSDWIEAVDSATEEVYGRAQKGSAGDIDRAVAAASSAFQSWSIMSPWERTPLLHRMANKLRSAAPALAPLLQKETGYRLDGLVPYFEFAAQIIDYYAELARTDIGRVVPSMFYPQEQLDLVIKGPLGVVGCFPPSNYPMVLLFWKVAPALAAGNTVVIKPHPLNPLIAFALAETVFDVLPPGVVNVVSGDVEAGRRLVEHPDVPMISYTGSTEIGTEIARIGAPLHKRLSLEMSGSDPAIVTRNADLDLAIEALVYSSFKNAGHICVSTERLFVEECLYEEFSHRLAERARGLTVGSGLDPETVVTPMRSAKARARAHALVEDAVTSGAKLLCGGDSSKWKRGFFYPPTIVADCKPTMRIMREESFGPVIAMASFSTFDDALRAANAHTLGLGACLYSNDPAEVHQFLNQIQAGNVWINDPLMDNISAPFGGTKATGFSRELGPEGLEAFRQTKHVVWDTHGKIKPYWFPRQGGAK